MTINAKNRRKFVVQDKIKLEIKCQFKLNYKKLNTRLSMIKVKIN